MILYYITDRAAFPGDEASRRRLLLEKIAEAARARIDYIQIREKDLGARDLESLVREALQVIRETKLHTAHDPLSTSLLINSRTDVAMAAQADGVHLRSDDVGPQEVRAVWHNSWGGNTLAAAGNPLISISCHSSQEVMEAAADQATLALFAPVFEKKDIPGAQLAGLENLREACRSKIPVLALGGVTRKNAGSCFAAGAAGIAAIRLFQENNIAGVVRELRDSYSSPK